MRKVLIATALSVILVPVTGVAQDCAEQFSAIQAQIEGARLQAAYKGREGEHPLVLNMKDGSLVDLTGVIVTATPYESWTGDKPVVDKVGGYLTEAKPLIEAGKNEECAALLEKTRAEIDAYSGPSDVTEN